MDGELGSTANGRVPPQDVEAERSVLGAMLLDREAVHEALVRLTSKDFYRPAHGLIFDALLALFDRNEPIDEITLLSELRSRGTLSAVGGSAALASLTEIVPTAANIIYYAKIVATHAMRRRLINAATSIATEGFDRSGADVEQLLDMAESKIFEISQSREKTDFVPVKDLVHGAFKAVEKLHANQETITGVPTGFIEFDNLTAGLQPADLIIVAGRPSMGKTAFALNIAQHAALATKSPVAIFSLEMARQQLVMRMLCAQSCIDGHRMRGGDLRQSDWPKLARAAGELAEAPIYIDDSGMLGVMEMRARCRRLQSEKGLELVVVDYLQLMRGRSGNEGREREISEISRGLKALAKELNIPVVALSQLNRSLEQRQDKRPMLSDLRESGAIEQDADVISFVYRDEYYNQDSEDKGLAEIIIGKQRNGATGVIKLKFQNSYVRFENLVPVAA